MKFRQGDLLIVKISGIPTDCIKQAHRILAEGEAAGHMHELDSGEVYEKEGTLFFRVPEEQRTTLKHPEHGPITFGPGVYKVIRQREYAPDGWRKVID